MVAYTKHAVHFTSKLVEATLKALIIYRQTVMRDAFVQTELFNMMAIAFVSMTAHAHYVAKHLKLDAKSKKTVTRANVKRVYGSVQIKHVVHAVEPLAIHIIRHLTGNTLISWENVRIIY